MGDLLQNVNLPLKGLPLMVEIPVHPDSAPFLVTGTKSWVWVPNARKGVLRSAVREGAVPDDVELNVVKIVAMEARDRKWGNVSAFSNAGLKQAVEYVKFYGIPEVEVIVPVGSGLVFPEGVSSIEVPWLPKRKAVVVPKDRSFLGILAAVGTDRHTVVVHNPSRGMAMLGRWW